MKIVRVTKENIHYAVQSVKLFQLSGADDAINESFFEDDKNFLLVALIEDNVVGSAYGYILDRYDKRKKQLFLYAIEVLHEYRNEGIGKALVHEFIKDINSGKFHNAFVITNKENLPAVKLYQSTGAIHTPASDGEEILFKWNPK